MPDAIAPSQTRSVPGLSPPRARMGLRLLLLLLAATLTLPLLGVAITALLLDHERARHRSDEQLIMQARGLATTVDSQLAIAAAVARTLAHSASLQRGDLVAFRAEMDSAIATLPGTVITLSDRRAMQRLTTRLPPGEELPAGTRAGAAEQVLASGRDGITDLFIGQVSQVPNLAAVALVPTAPEAPETAPGAVSVVLHANTFATLLQAQATKPGWIATLSDRQFRLVSRSVDGERYAFVRRNPPAVLAALRQQESGVARFVRPDGVAAEAAFARAPISGYLVVIGRPAAELAQALRASMLGVLAGAVPVTLLGFGLALWLSRRIIGAVSALAAPSGQATSGLRFREVDRIAERLAAAERWRTVLMHEMTHRLKNLLMTVQAVASQTLRSADGDLEQFRQSFMARLATLARAQDLLTNTAGQGASIVATLETGLAPWLEGNNQALRLTVTEDFGVNARQAQALILAMHELATNAVKYGALSCDGGRVAVECVREPDGQAVLTWREHGGPPVTARPLRRGFGSRLLDVVLPQDLGPGATVERDLAPGGLYARIRFHPPQGVIEDADAVGPR